MSEVHGIDLKGLADLFFPPPIFSCLGIRRNLFSELFCKVHLVGLVKERAARIGRNPATGTEIEIPASKAPAFKPGKALKDAIQ